MDNIDIDELIQLLNFYKHKSSELEFQNLKLQIKINKIEENNYNDKVE